MKRRWGGRCSVCPISVFRRGLGLLCSLPSPGLGSGGFCGVSDARGAWLGTWCLRVPVDVCMVRSNGSEGSVLLQLVSGGVVWTGTSSSVTRPGLGWQGVVFLGMAVPKHTTLKNCSRSLTRIKTYKTHWITPKSIFLGRDGCLLSHWSLSAALLCIQRCLIWFIFLSLEPPSSLTIAMLIITGVRAPAAAGVTAFLFLVPCKQA